MRSTAGAAATRAAHRHARRARYEARSVLLLVLVIALLVLAASWVASTRSSQASRSPIAQDDGEAASVTPPFDLDGAIGAPGPDPKLLVAPGAPAAATGPFAAVAAELAIGGMVVESPAVLPASVRISVQATSRGAAAAVSVLLLLDGTIVGTGELEASAVREGAASVAVEVPDCTAGAHIAVAIVDPANVIAERDERNNVRMRELEFSC